jgi:RAB protein geranylgeranyltransferase component A
VSLWVLNKGTFCSALAKSGRSVLHLDENSYYGGSEASLSLEELYEWAEQRASEGSSDASDYLLNERSLVSHVEHSSLSDDLKRLSRRYSLSLSPSLVPSVGPFIDTLVNSGVSKYSNFKLLDAVGIYDRETGLSRVPMNKESIFKDGKLSLVDKRRLMKFITWAATDWETDELLQGTCYIPLTATLL